MNIYLIFQEERRDYDYVWSAVVVAESEEEARQMDPSTGEPHDWGEPYPVWCSSPDEVMIRYLGQAGPEVGKGVVCRDFHAG